MKQNTESTFKGVVKTLQSLSQRLLRSANNMENIILVYCFVRRLFHTFSFSLLMNQHTGLLTPAASFTFSILFTYLYMYYLLFMQNCLYLCLFYCTFCKNKWEWMFCWHLLPTVLFLFLNESTFAKDGLKAN